MAEENLLLKKIYKIDDLPDNITEHLNKIYSLNIPMRDCSYYFPNKIADGFCRRILLKNEIDISFENIKFYKDIKMSGITKGDIYVVYFSLDKEMNWIEEISKSEWQINNKKGIFLLINDFIVESCILNECRRNKGISISISKKKLDEYLGENFILKYYKNNKNFQGIPFRINENIRRILLQIYNCPFRNDLKYMYLEGKVLELFFNIINQITNNTKVLDKDLFSKSDLKGIEEVKKIIDYDISKIISIKDLSRLGHINECKLKSGFKKIYGKTVHTYVVDLRMEYALKLLEDGVYINEVAYKVGYSDSSSFSRAFKKRYGFSPKYIKNK